jgi:hypothetical protein
VSSLTAITNNKELALLTGLLHLTPFQFNRVMMPMGSKGGESHLLAQGNDYIWIASHHIPDS